MCEPEDAGHEAEDVALLDIAEPDAIPGLRYPLASREELDEATRLVEAEGATAISVVADIRDSAALNDAVERTEAELGRLDILVTNAAIWMETAPGETDMERWQTELDVNLTGTNRTIEAALPALLRQSGGRIVIISSFNARVGADLPRAFPPPLIRVRPDLRTNNGANKLHGRADHRHPRRA